MRSSPWGAGLNLETIDFLFFFFPVFFPLNRAFAKARESPFLYVCIFFFVVRSSYCFAWLYQIEVELLAGLPRGSFE